MALSLDLEQNPTHWSMTLVGDLDYGECTQFRMGIDRILRSGSRSTVVDLSELGYLDSSGLGLLLAMSRQHAAAGGQLVLITNRTVDNILSLSRLHGIFATASSMPDAMQMLAPVAPTLLSGVPAPSAATGGVVDRR
jgi:anti-sigma B factor antagonist